LRRIELPSEDLAEELRGHLEGKRYRDLTYDKARRAIYFPDDVDPSQWSGVTATVEKWARGKNLEVVASMRLQYHKGEGAPPRTESKGEPRGEPKGEQKADESAADPRVLAADAKKKVDGLTPEKAEARYLYLSSKPLGELTDAEYQERITLAQRSFEKKSPKK
jgi:hypothetical protein